MRDLGKDISIIGAFMLKSPNGRSADRYPLSTAASADIQAHLRHSKADTTANEYMQEKPESVKTMVGSVYAMIKKGGDSKEIFEDLLPNATNIPEPAPVSY